MEIKSYLLIKKALFLRNNVIFEKLYFYDAIYIKIILVYTLPIV